MSGKPQNRDVWIEIMRYFQISLTRDKADNIKIRRRTLLSLALTSPGLTSIALDELWRSMSSLTPVVQILNNTSSLVSGANNPALQWNSDHWEIKSLSRNKTGKLISIVSPYLLRIERLHYQNFPSQEEYMLWQALGTFDELNPLCPRLRELSIFIHYNTAASWAYHISPLISSPSMATIRLNTQVGYLNSEMAACIMLDTLKYRRIGITSISYTGNTSYRVLLRAMSFTTLESVALPSRRQDGSSLTPAHITSFYRIKNLSSLDVHLSHFDDPRALEDFGKWLQTIGSESLSSITFRGLLKDVYTCIQNRTSMTSINSFGVYIEDVHNNSAVHLSTIISRLPIIAPNLHTLHVEVISGSQLTLLSLSDLLSLRDMPIRSLAIYRSMVLASPTKGLIDIISTWATLRNIL
ncbi:hypothetical protein NP233_g6500 [Leucocoprinus birnbaumii]|uniref:Uncharacterized protein n=1 Tax=Leucocoprinus birnbaumii TaxID=56174 RepID=A0AAD5VR23_9AGAR|nr:hypothetical protein NP233_g6500 [Leucocoprinus birnbaumii]